MNTETPVAPFDVVLADPCWRYRNVKTGGSHTSGAAQKYPTMSVEEIAALPVPRIMARSSSVCFLWATTPLGVDPYEVLDRWGYTFKTKWYWHKTGRKGTGYWTRGCVEEVLIGVRGQVKAWRSNLDNWIEASELPPLLSIEPRAEVFSDELTQYARDLVTQPGRIQVVSEPVTFDGVFESKPEGHSRKPAVVRSMVEFLTPDAKHVELFATERVPGWASYGLALDAAHDFRTASIWDHICATSLPESSSSGPT